MSADMNVKQVRLIPGRGGSGGDEELGLEGQEGGSGNGTRKQGRKRANHKTFKVGVITKEGGGSTSPGTMTQLTTSHVPGTATAVAAAEALGVNSAMTQKGSPLGGVGAGATGGGGAQPASTATSVKVVLAAAKKPKGKVVLAAAAAPKPAMVAAAQQRGKTRKMARKIKVSMSSLSKKIHRAKTIRHKATKDMIEEIKKVLHKAGLIKLDSKAPEAILRQMYADFMTLKNRAL